MSTYFPGAFWIVDLGNVSFYARFYAEHSLPGKHNHPINTRWVPLLNQPYTIANTFYKKYM